MAGDVWNIRMMALQFPQRLDIPDRSHSRSVPIARAGEAKVWERRQHDSSPEGL